MRIDGPIPLHSPLARIASAWQAQHPSVVGKIAPNPAAQVHPAKPVTQLVAAKMNQPIDFKREAMPAAPAQRGVFQMYTRAADRIEAAVHVELGREIDIRV